MSQGIDVRHARGCKSRAGGRCNCSPSYQAHVWDAAGGRRIRKTFRNPAEAFSWRQDALRALERGTLRTDGGPTIAEAAEAWLAGAAAGQVRNRSGDTYKPAAIRTYEMNLRLRVLPEFGHKRLHDVDRVDLQRFVDRLVADGMAPPTVMTTLLPLRAIYRRAVARGEVSENPTRGLEMPAIRRSVRVVPSPEHAEALLAVLEGEDRALWATAMYAGLRRGELTALRWEDVDLASGVIRVRRGWDQVEGEIAPKSREGRRNVPVPAPLRDVLLEHRMNCPARDSSARVFRSASMVAKAVHRAGKVWRAADLEPITLHEARHTYASFMIAAGVNAKALQTFMGHANIAVTLDLYSHLMPGSEAEAAGLLERFLERGRAACSSGDRLDTVAA